MTSPVDEPTAADKGVLTVLLVTGMSGAGKTSALKALEDLGYEAIDNVPLSLLDSLVFPSQRSLGAREFQSPLAIGIDIRTRDFGAKAFSRELDRLKDERSVKVQVMFLDCDDEQLRRRYAETRHRHPLALDRPVEDGIAHERRLMAPIRDRADLTVDTSDASLGDLKRILEGHFRLGNRQSLTVFVTSFSFRHGIPREADLVFDVRFLANPHYDSDLRHLTGKDSRVGAFVSADPGFERFFSDLSNLLAPLLPRYAEEGKSYLTIAIGCTGGRHRSVFVAEQLSSWLEKQGSQIHLVHRELDETRKA
ncbi:MAG: RNase adapter RapZ [Rhodospirillales bacterium]|nr:RNase adapter RapZ [Rhodospirillales bacterium]